MYDFVSLAFGMRYPTLQVANRYHTSGIKSNGKECEYG